MQTSELRRLRVYWRSLGCKVNLADLGKAISDLPSEGIDFSASLEEADVALLNTCTVTHRADSDWRKLLSGWQRRRPGMPVLVTGCAAVCQENRLRSFSNVMKVFRPGAEAELKDALCSLMNGRVGEAPSMSHCIGVSGLGRQRAYLKVQDGCDARCSYCLVSRIRGPERSLPLREAVRSCEELLDAGHREIVLCGIHLGRYGWRQGTSLAELLRALMPLYRRRPGWRLRLSSIEPLEWSEALLEAIAESEFVCRHFHVPVQSADDALLRAMGRPYDSDAARRILERLRMVFPEAALGSDFLVGFPGEDQAAFERTEAFVAKGWFDYLHVFAFSPRPQTPAARLAGRVPSLLVKERVKRLRLESQRRWREFLSRGVGKKHTVLIEKMAAFGAEGKSEAYRKLRFSANGQRKGEMVEVWGESLGDGFLQGRALPSFGG